MAYVPCMPAWSTCPRTNVSINVPTCQRCANYSTWCANVPTACQFLNLACQRAKWHANFSFWHANLPEGMLNFQTFLLRNAKGNFHTLMVYKKFCIILDIIVIHMTCICIVHKDCIILHFFTSCHIKEKCAEFLAYRKIGTQDLKVGPGPRTLRWDTKVKPCVGTLWWDPKMWPQGENQTDCFYPNCFF